MTYHLTFVYSDSSTRSYFVSAKDIPSAINGIFIKYRLTSNPKFVIIQTPEELPDVSKQQHLLTDYEYSNNDGIETAKVKHKYAEIVEVPLGDGYISISYGSMCGCIEEMKFSK